MKKIISVAIIGAGYMATEHIKAFSSIEGVKVVGIFSRTKSRAEEVANKYTIEHVSDSVSDLFEKTNAEIVVVTTPELETRKICSEVFKFSWASLIEKPVGYNYEEAKLILEESEKYRTHSFVALNRRHYSSTVFVLKDVINFQGKRILQITDQEDLIGAKKSGQPELVIKNWMYANAIHIIDYINVFMRGEIQNVEYIEKWNPENPFYTASKILFSSGDTAIYQCFWNAPGPWSVSLTTNMRKWEMRPLEQVSYQDFGQRKIENIEKSHHDLDFKPGLKIQAEEMIKFIKGKEHRLPDLKEAIKSMELVKRIYEI
jgi:predicted dehydrogenase